jgi:hypothetical protein
MCRLQYGYQARGRVVFGQRLLGLIIVPDLDLTEIKARFGLPE